MARPKELTTDELQLLGMLANEHGYTDLYKKCCSMMFQNMHVVSSLEQVYEKLVKQFKLRCELNFDTEDKLNRAANIYAVKNTTKEWRKQYEY